MSGRTRGVALPALDNRDQNQRLIEVGDLYRVAKHILDRTLWPGDLNELLRSTAVLEGEEVVDRQLAHELRLKRIPVSEVGTVGKQTLAQLIATVTVAVEHSREALVDEQPGCTWRLAAAVVEQFDTTQTEAVSRSSVAGGIPSARSVLRDLTGEEENPPPMALNQRHDHEQRQRYKMVLYLVWADVGRGVLRDPAAAHAETTEGQNGPMSRYRVSRRFSQLSDSGQRQRERAEDLIREFLELGAGEVLVDDPAMPAMNQPTLDARTRRILDLTAAGHAPGRIGRELGLPVAVIRDTLATHRPENTDG